MNRAVCTLPHDLSRPFCIAHSGHMSHSRACVYVRVRARANCACMRLSHFRIDKFIVPIIQLSCDINLARNILQANNYRIVVRGFVDECALAFRNIGVTFDRCHGLRVNDKTDVV